jgi:hypothetical protein
MTVCTVNREFAGLAVEGGGSSTINMLFLELLTVSATGLRRSNYYLIWEEILAAATICQHV